MLEEERNKYFEQAREATLAEISTNQQAMLDEASAGSGQQPEQQGVYVGHGMTMPEGLAQQVNGPQEQAAPEAAPFESPINPNLVADAAQEYQGVDTGKFTVPSGLVKQANDAAVAAQNPSASPFDDAVDQAYAEKEAQQKQAEMARILDPRVQRAENSRKWIAGIGDALASIANMVGTGNDAASQKQTYMLPGVNEAIEQDRRRRADQYQKQLDRINQLELQKQKAAADAAEKQREREFKAAQNEAERKQRQEQSDRDFKYKQDKDARDFDYKKDQDAKKSALDEWKAKQTVAQGWSRIAKMKDNNNPSGGDGEDNGSNGRFSGKKGGGIKEAKIDYNAMLDEIAERNGCADWADLSNRAKNDRNLRGIYNQFDLGKDKAGAAKIEGMISSYARNYAPEFWAHYFGESPQGGVNFNEYKSGAGAPAANAGGTLGSIMSSTPQGGSRGRNRRRDK